jgi:hypothetical protein
LFGVSVIIVLNGDILFFIDLLFLKYFFGLANIPCLFLRLGTGLLNFLPGGTLLVTSVRGWTLSTLVPLFGRTLRPLDWGLCSCLSLCCYSLALWFVCPSHDIGKCAELNSRGLLS